MKALATARSGLGAAAFVASLAACGGSQPPIGAPGATTRTATAPAYRSGSLTLPAAATKGIYVSEQYNFGVVGYRGNNRKNGPPECSVNRPAYSLSVDGKGNLIVSEGSNGVEFFQGPGMCGTYLGGFTLGWHGEAIDAAGLDSQDGTIAVASEASGYGGGGSIEICALGAGCTTNLTNPSIKLIQGVSAGVKLTHPAG
jgi:hypothetical protein